MLPDRLIPSVVESIPTHIRAELETDHFVVASHDCDVNSVSLEAEPFVELVVARDVPRLNGSLANVKSTRRLHLPGRCPAGECVLELWSHNRFFVPRQLLARDGPSKERFLETAAKKTLRAWLSARFGRAAFPDTFVERLDPKGLEKVLKVEAGKFLAGVYFQVSPLTELLDDQEYLLQAKVTMKVEDYEDSHAREQVASIVNGLEAHLDQCTRISLDEDTVKLLSEADFSSDDLRNSQRFTVDHLSLRHHDATEPAEGFE